MFSLVCTILCWIKRIRFYLFYILHMEHFKVLFGLKKHLNIFSHNLDDYHWQFYPQYACLYFSIFQFNWHLCHCIFKLILGPSLLCFFLILCWCHPHMFFSPIFKNPHFVLNSYWMIHLTTILHMYIVNPFNDFIPCLYHLSLHIVIFSIPYFLFFFNILSPFTTFFVLSPLHWFSL